MFNMLVNTLLEILVEKLCDHQVTRIAIIFIQQKPETAGFKKPYLSNIIDQKFNKRVLNQQTSLKFALVIWS